MTTIERPRSADLLDQVMEAGDKLRELRNAPAEKRGDTYEKDLRAATSDVNALDAQFTLAQKAERDAIERYAWEHAVANPPAPESRGPQAAFVRLDGEDRSAGHSVIESEQYRNKAKGAHLADVEVRNLLTSGAHGEGSNLLVPVGSPQIFPGTLQRRRPFVRDLMGVQNTTLASVPYIREVSPLVNEGGASAVSEASAKPEVTAQFEQDDAPIRKIAAWIQATMEALDDAPTLQGYVDQRLAYMLMIREEQQLINGSGNAPRIKGLLQFDDVQAETGELYVGVGESIGKIENVDGDPDGVVVNPLDFWAAVTDRHSEQFDGQSQSGTSPFGTPTPTIWGLTPVRTRAVAPATAIVGAFGVGTTLFERQGVTVRSTDSHASLFTSNIILILAEERVGLAVHRPDWFVELTVSAPS